MMKEEGKFVGLTESENRVSSEKGQMRATRFCDGHDITRTQAVVTLEEPNYVRDGRPSPLRVPPAQRLPRHTFASAKYR